MARERNHADPDISRMEAELDTPCTMDLVRSSGVEMPHQFKLAADYLGLRSPRSGEGHIDDLHQVETIRRMYEQSRSGHGPNLTDWRRQPRPKSAQYMRPRCRMTPDGGGGAPLQRPSSAPSGRPENGRRAPKTERWRESGMTRWPKPSEKQKHASDPSDGDPLRRGEPAQPNWNGELWIRSLRRPGVEIQDPAYHDVSQRGMRELHEEWQEPPQSPRRPQSARGMMRKPVPYGGSTAIGKAALPRRQDQEAWVERPVATGKMALKHFGGQRYAFSQESRCLEWDDYLRNINPNRT